jgi:hypothetical protein
MSEEIIKAHCVAQEYWYIRRNKCSCGGAFKTLMQGVGPYLDTTVDTISTACDACGHRRSFIFENSTFYGRTYETMMLRRALSSLQNEELRNKILTKMAVPPMESTIGYIMELGEACDMLALDYLQEAIEYARKKSQSI